MPGFGIDTRRLRGHVCTLANLDVAYVAW
ncbi:hypothetical protein FAIPA1_270063 [Frankia sp. AiPs1]